MNLPKAFEEKMIGLLEEEYKEYLQCFDEARHYGLRVNTNKITVEDFLKIAPWPLTPIPWIKNGFYYDGETVQPAKHPYYFAGLYYLQEPSAMTPADRLPIEPGDRVLDVCAAPGGKATELGARLKGQGVLVANDISNSRAKGLLKNLELFGISNMLVLSEEPGKLTGFFREYFDKILIDAPCSGEGMFRKDKKMIRAWEEHGPDFFSKIQQSIILQAGEMLKPGGMLLYSTCTFDPLENERTVEYLLSKCPSFEICPMTPFEGFSPGLPACSEGGLKELNQTVRIFPHKMKGEGHYLALLKKAAGEGQDSGEVRAAIQASRPETLAGRGHRKGTPWGRGYNGGNLPDSLNEFFEDVARIFEGTQLSIQGERVYYMPEGLPALRGLRFLRSGLLMGELKKNRFEPSQALAMCLKKQEYKKVLDFPLTDVRVKKYLKGETLDVGDLVSDKEKGWYLVCVDGYSLGFGKVSGQTLKNKYLPGWRWQS